MVMNNCLLEIADFAPRAVIARAIAVAATANAAGLSRT